MCEGICVREGVCEGVCVRVCVCVCVKGGGGDFRGLAY